MRVQSNSLDATPLPFLLALGAAALISLSLGAPVAAQTAALPKGVYLIPPGDDRVDECLAKSAECARVVASAWCEANGHGSVRAFGSANDVTFSAGPAVKAPPRDAIMISCDD